MYWDTDSSSGSQSTWRIKGLSPSDWREAFFKTFRDSVIYDSNDILGVLLGDLSPLNPVESSSLPSQRREIVEEIVKHILENCKDEIDAIKQAHRPEPDPDYPIDNEYRPEYAMYGPLRKILKKIGETYESLVQTSPDPLQPPNFGSSTHLPRVFLDYVDMPLVANDSVHPNAFPIGPDFPLVEGRAVHSGMRPLWRQCPAFLEVKAHDTDSPIPPGVTTPPPSDAQLPGSEESLHSAYIWEARPLPGESLARCAEYARAILACRPFQLSVFGLILWGTNFAVAHFDRRGAVLSPAHSILEQDGLRVFVRIVLRMTWEMSDTELGRDPTVAHATEDTLDHTNPLLFPRFIPKTVCGHSAPQDTWMTIGRPLWCSPALLGRGTSVWWAVDREKNPLILKMTWRSPNRLSERRIYDEIVKIVGGVDRLPRGMVRCGEISGGDVLLDAGEEADPRDMLLTVDGIRGGRASTAPRGRLYGARGNGILHRIAFRDVGKPLWTFTCPEQLVRALLVCLEAHKHLSRLGILHRDISAGNILIRVRPRVVFTPNGDVQSIEWDELSVELSEGFLTDFEFASLPGGAQHTNPEAEDRDGMTGTLLFTPTVLLRAISKSRALVRTAAHDLESLLWTLLYVVYKNAVDEGGANSCDTKPGPLRKDFSELFQGSSPAEIVKSREVFLRGREKREHHQRGRLFEYAWRRSSEGKNFGAVIEATHVALEVTWQEPNLVEHYQERKAEYMMTLFRKTVAPVKEDPPSLHYDGVETVLKQFWKRMSPVT